MRTALETLGFGPCHHMRALYENPDHKAHWRRFIAGGPCDWDVLLGGFRSCVDWPSAHFWPELAQAFPHAKIILTWRSPESWWRSFESTILEVLQNRDPDAAPTPGSLLLPKHVFGGRSLTKANCIAAFEANAARVKAEVPQERLLIHEIGDGWHPLCAHLGVPVPSDPYPQSNSTAEFRADMDRAEWQSPSKESG